MKKYIPLRSLRMLSKLHIGLILLTGYLGIYSSMAVAGPCRSTTPMLVKPPSPLNYSGQANGVFVGQQIGSWGGTTAVWTVFNGCDMNIRNPIVYAKPRDIATGVTFTSNGVSYPVYPTGIDGIGYIIGIKDTWGSVYTPINTPKTQTFPVAGIIPGARDSIGFSSQVLFVATGTLKSGSYTIPQRIVADLQHTDNGGTITTQTTLSIGAVTINVNAIGCTINTGSSMNIPLGIVNASDFSSVGTTLAEKGFSIGLTCDANANINLSLSGEQSSEVANDSVLALTNSGSAGTAAGVGVQFVYGGAPLRLNNRFVFKRSPGGVETIPLSVRYYQTKPSVNVGDANSSATLAITYQ